MVFEIALAKNKTNARVIAATIYLLNEPVTTIAIIAQAIEIKDKVKTAKSWEKPWCNNLWWRCSESATKGLWPFEILLKEA